jgi:hypothetical protein
MASLTEKGWLSRAKPSGMLQFLDKRASDRKLRLLCCAVCRRVMHLFPDERVQCLIAATEQYADGKLSRDELDRLYKIANGLAREHPVSKRTAVLYPVPLALGLTYRNLDASFLLLHALDCQVADSTTPGARKTETRIQIQLLHDVFGNPFRPVTLDPDWLTWNSGLIPGMAGTIYEERTWERLPILADALEDAGCAETDILDHLRAPDVLHIRGCWVLDLLLGKE